jgi:hypothetical protein
MLNIKPGHPDRSEPVLFFIELWESYNGSIELSRTLVFGSGLSFAVGSYFEKWYKSGTKLVHFAIISD